MKLHELKQKRNTIAREMRALHEGIPENTTWTEEQRTQWNKAKHELDALDEQIGREEELRRHDQSYVDEQEPEQRQRQINPEKQADERRAAAFDRLLRHGFGELTAEDCARRVRLLMIKGAIPYPPRCAIPSSMR
ncbi:phage capsid protein [Klebsiella pneumoniae]|nr:phage capsid protein [Klebsiella pneumoniae]